MPIIVKVGKLVFFPFLKPRKIICSLFFKSDFSLLSCRVIDRDIWLPGRKFPSSVSPLDKLLLGSPLIKTIPPFSSFSDRQCHRWREKKECHTKKVFIGPGKEGEQTKTRSKQTASNLLF